MYAVTTRISTKKNELVSDDLVCISLEIVTKAALVVPMNCAHMDYRSLFLSLGFFLLSLLQAPGCEWTGARSRMIDDRLDRVKFYRGQGPSAWNGGTAL